MMKYNIVYEQDQPTSVTVFEGGRFYTAAPGHPSFEGIVQALQEGADHDPQEIVDMFDLRSVLARGFKAARGFLARITSGDDSHLKDLSERIEIDPNGNVIFDGEALHGVISETILAYYRQGSSDFVPLVRFLDRLLRNSGKHSREHLYSWMRHLSFSIREDGRIAAYKSVSGVGNGQYVSHTAGRGVVDGVKYVDFLPNNPGSVLEMERKDVAWDPSEACGAGLHVGTVAYARNFGEWNYDAVLIEVAVDPSDVVSVPTDCHGQKMRVCRYEVIRVLQPHEVPETFEDEEERGGVIV